MSDLLSNLPDLTLYVGSATIKFYVAVPLPPHTAWKICGILKTHGTNV